MVMRKVNMEDLQRVKKAVRGILLHFHFLCRVFVSLLLLERIPGEAYLMVSYGDINRKHVVFCFDGI